MATITVGADRRRDAVFPDQAPAIQLAQEILVYPRQRHCTDQGVARSRAMTMLDLESTSRLRLASAWPRQLP